MTEAEPQSSVDRTSLEYAKVHRDCGVLIADLKDQIAHLTGYADGLKRGSDLLEQRRRELEKQVAEISKHDVCTDRLITTLRERDEARAQLTAQAERVAYWQRNAEPSGESVNAVIEAARLAAAEFSGDPVDELGLAVRLTRLAKALARLGDAADVPADHAVTAANRATVECNSPDGRWHRRPDGVWEPAASTGDNEQ